jgi:aromatic-L-amino-acid decarboxylase
MSPEDLEFQARRVLTDIAEYRRHPERYRVLSAFTPGEAANQLPSSPSPEPEPMENIFEEFRRLLPGFTHWNHPGFFGYFSITGSGPAILGEMWKAALNVNPMKWRTSPAAVEIEETAVDHVRQMIDLPPAFRGMVTDSASTSTLLAVIAARESLPGLQLRQRGLAGRDLPRLRLYASSHAHSSVEKDAIVAGIGSENVRRIPVNKAYQMDPAALEQAISADLDAGFLPFCVVATAGTTSSTSIDPLSDVADVCDRFVLWMHVDGAYGATARIVPEFRPLTAGLERADSLVLNPHKWLATTMGCSVLLVRRPEALQRAFSLVPEYLQGPAEGTDFMNWGFQLGRPFSALPLWFVLRYYGQRGLAANIREHVRMAQQFAAWVDSSRDFERLAPTPLSTVCFRARPGQVADEAALNEMNEKVLDCVNASGEVFLSPTRLDGRFTLRLTIGNFRTEMQHVERAWQLCQDALTRCLVAADGRQCVHALTIPAACPTGA